MMYRPWRGAIGAVGMMLSLLFLGSWSAAQDEKSGSKLKNVELCNGIDRSSPEPQITGCTALIDAGNDTTRVLAIAHNNRGDALIAKGDYDSAIADYDAAIKLDPTYVKPFNNRGVAYLKKGEYARAIKEFDQAIKFNPTYANAFANRAEAYKKMREYARAAQDYDNAIRIKSDEEALWNERCWVRAILGQLQPALADCGVALRMRPNDANDP